MHMPMQDEAQARFWACEVGKQDFAANFELCLSTSSSPCACTSGEQAYDRPHGLSDRWKLGCTEFWPLHCIASDTCALQRTSCRVQLG